MNYSVYHMSIIEKVKYGLLGMGVAFMFSYLFYNNLFISFFLCWLGILYIPYQRKQIIKKRKKMLKQQFKEGLFALSSSISAGKSIEQAFIDACNDLKIVYSNEKADIIKEFELIIRKIAMNDTIEDALLDFANRSNEEDILNFTNVFLTAKRSGGNLVEIMKYTTTTINEKIEISDNIDILITGKKYEQRILCLLIPLIIVYLKLFSSGFMEPMYHTIIGNIAMTIALFLYVAGIMLSYKIVDIEV